MVHEESIAEAGATALPPPRVLLVGGAAGHLGAAFNELKPEVVEQADTFVEAILLATHPFDLVVAAMGQDEELFEKALAAFRRVHASGEILLLCQVWEEPRCRRALQLGATDYEVLPVSVERLRARLRMGAEGARAPDAPPAAMVKEAPATPVVEGARAAVKAQKEAHGESAGANDLDELLADVTPAPVKPQLQLLDLPLAVQSVMMEDLLQARPDLAARGVAILQAYWNPPGTLRLILPGAPEPEGKSLRTPLTHHTLNAGTLVLEGADGNDALLTQLDQAGMWLGGWMTLAHRMEQLRQLAITDELSGASNRRHFLQFLRDKINRARDGRYRVTVLLFDIDDFKRYNDEYGHAAGDAIIKEMIGLLRRCTRDSDLIARIGGDEFAVVFWDSEKPRQPNSEHPRSVFAVTERFRKAIETNDWGKIGNISGQVRVSGGLATFPRDAETLEALLKRADEALLKAKRGGKNAFLFHEPAAEAGAETEG